MTARAHAQRLRPQHPLHRPSLAGGAGEGFPVGPSVTLVTGTVKLLTQ